MFLVQKVISRKSIDVPFYEWPQEYIDYFRSTYVATNKSASSTIAKSADGLSLVITSIWENEESFKEFIADPFIVEHMYLRNKYNLANDIVGMVPEKAAL
jgi:hypothetical protein